MPKMKFLCEAVQKLEPEQTDTIENITYLHSRVVMTFAFALYRMKTTRHQVSVITGGKRANGDNGLLLLQVTLMGKKHF